MCESVSRQPARPKNMPTRFSPRGPGRAPGEDRAPETGPGRGRELDGQGPGPLCSNKGPLCGWR
eukprot:8032892-Pyramimonas_sp.AAC.1